MAQLFKYCDGFHYGSIPTLPLIPKAYAFCAFKSIGYIATRYKYCKRIGRVVRIITPNDSAHRWWECQKADGYVAPSPTDTVVVVSFPNVGEDQFLLCDLVHVTPLFLN